MATQVFLEALMLLFGYFCVSKFVAVEKRGWGFFIAIVLVSVIHMFESHIPLVPWRVSLILTAYAIFGVGVKSIYKPDRPEKGPDSKLGDQPNQGDDNQ